MNSKKSLLGLGDNAKHDGQSQPSAEQTPAKGNTMSLVYPDGQVTNVKVGQK